MSPPSWLPLGSWWWWRESCCMPVLAGAKRLQQVLGSRLFRSVSACETISSARCTMSLILPSWTGMNDNDDDDDDDDDWSRSSPVLKTGISKSNQRGFDLDNAVRSWRLRCRRPVPVPLFGELVGVNRCWSPMVSKVCLLLRYLSTVCVYAGLIDWENVVLWEEERERGREERRERERERHRLLYCCSYVSLQCLLALALFLKFSKVAS